jgi:hypothetical protein
MSNYLIYIVTAHLSKQAVVFSRFQIKTLQGESMITDFIYSLVQFS